MDEWGGGGCMYVLMGMISTMTMWVNFNIRKICYYKFELYVMVA